MAAGSFERASADRRPSPPQVYRIARAACELLGVEYPADRQAASQLIARLDDARERGSDAGTAFAVTSTNAPF